MKTNLKPAITETTMKLAKEDWYTLAAPLDKTKTQLREEVEKAFNVNVLDIKTAVVKGKIKRSPTTRKKRKTSNWKKVIVKLVKGQKIEFFDVGGA